MVEQEVVLAPEDAASTSDVAVAVDESAEIVVVESALVSDGSTGYGAVPSVLLSPDHVPPVGYAKPPVPVP